MLQHILTRKKNFNIILCLIYLMNLEISQFSLSCINLLSLRTVNISTPSQQRTVPHQVMIPVMIEVSPPLWIRTNPPERLCNMWTPGGKNQMQVLYRIRCIIRFADGCCILSWFNLPKKKQQFNFTDFFGLTDWHHFTYSLLSHIYYGSHLYDVYCHININIYMQLDSYALLFPPEVKCSSCARAQCCLPTDSVAQPNRIWPQIWSWHALGISSWMVRETWDLHHFPQTKREQHVKFSMWNMRFSSFLFSTFDFEMRFGLKKNREFTWSNLVAFAWGVPFFHRYQGLPWSAFFPPPISRNAQGALGRDKIRNETPAVAMVRSQKLTQLDLFPNSRSMSNHFRETSSKISIKGVNLFETGQGHNSPLFETGHISPSLLGHQRRWREQKDETRVHA